MDAIYLLNWLEENEEAIKQRAINALMAHLKRCQSSLGLGEKLSQEDYSFSMMVQMGPTSKIHPTSRDEASLSILDYPHLVKYFPTSYDVNDDCERNVIINAYVHLLDPARRRVVAIRKMHEEKVRQQQQPACSVSPLGQGAGAWRRRAVSPRLTRGLARTWRWTSPQSAIHYPAFLSRRVSRRSTSWTDHSWWVSSS